MSDRPTPETADAYKQRDGEGALDHEIRRAKTMENLERQRDELREALQQLHDVTRLGHPDGMSQMATLKGRCEFINRFRPIHFKAYTALKNTEPTKS